MATGKRSDFFGMYYMPEAAYGTDPGIVAASVVTGGAAAETFKYLPTSSRKAWIRLSEKPTGLPKLPLVEIPQVFSTHDYEFCRVQGIQDTGEISVSMELCGPVTDYGTTGDTDQLLPPPWLHLMASASGLVLKGAVADTIDTVTDADTFVVTTGTVDEGIIIAIDSPGVTAAGAGGYEVVRLTDVTNATTVAAVSYDGVTWGFVTTPVAADPVYYAAQVAFDKRYEGVSESFTLLIQRDNSEASLVITGARCSSWEVSSKVGETPKAKINFIYKNFVYSTDVIDDEPGYFENFPCPVVTQGANMQVTWDIAGNGTVDATDRKTDMEVQSIMIKWNAGYGRRKASTATGGIAETVANARSSFEVAFETVYEQDWRTLIGICCNENFANITFAYWESSSHFVRTSDTATRRGAWGVFVTAGRILEDPGSEGEIDSIMHQTIRLGAGNYTADGGDTPVTFSTSKHYNSKFQLFVV